MSGVVVDPEFERRLPALSPEEFAQLEANILSEGCRDPLVVWAGLLLDGHHRYAICRKHDLPFRVVTVTLTDHRAALEWIDKNALGTRNLTKDALKIVMARQFKATKKPAHRPKKGSQTATLSGKTAAAIGKAAGVDPATVYRAAKDVAELSAGEQQSIIAGETTIRATKHKHRECEKEKRRKENAKKADSCPTPTAAGVRFATIVMDPPWDKGDEGDVDQMGREKPSYATMPIGDITALPVPDLVDVDCHLYLWITNRSLPKGFALLEAWGFRYITCITWVKPSFGMGNYFRGQTEQVLFGVKGSQSLKRKNAPTVFAADRGPDGHSSKPPAFLEFVESCSPGPYLEMFARSGRKGWTAWGADA